MTTVCVAATQMACDWNLRENIRRAKRLVRTAAGRGAQIVLLQELFETPYFCIERTAAHHTLARSFHDHAIIAEFAELAKALRVVLPVSYFESADGTCYNALCVIDADGAILGNYRKAHLPQGPGYEERYYFTPGDSGFQCWDTAYARIGVGICWDQWFPECARCMALMGAEMILFPSAIGSEPEEPGVDSCGHWQRTMQGHAAANMVPVIASNRIGVESGDHVEVTFYGSSFIADHTGAKVTECDRYSEAVIVHEFDLQQIASQRAAWGLFSDRRPDLYAPLTEPVEG